ncbi:hypothetical protein Hamer_G027623 [Homarus americanus]|uniref:Uncharacterized protein n=1 Tax=Homarus americanus TaxID=6706 RepID=A0A8J5NFQ9_HOMAM|nr:hypothetical protein Hamer_G027623 [Homarus americanus]
MDFCDWRRATQCISTHHRKFDNHWPADCHSSVEKTPFFSYHLWCCL